MEDVSTVLDVRYEVHCSVPNLKGAIHHHPLFHVLSFAPSRTLRKSPLALCDSINRQIKQTQPTATAATSQFEHLLSSFRTSSPHAENELCPVKTPFNRCGQFSQSLGAWPAPPPPSPWRGRTDPCSAQVQAVRLEPKVSVSGGATPPIMACEEGHSIWMRMPHL